MSRWPRKGFLLEESDAINLAPLEGSKYACSSEPFSAVVLHSFTGEAKEFLIKGLGVIYACCISFEFDLSVATGLAWSLNSYCFIILGIDVMLLFPSVDEFGDVRPLMLIDLQIVVLTIKLPDTDFVLVMDRAARKNTPDFVLIRPLSSVSIV